MRIDKHSVEEIRQGYTFSPGPDVYTCLVCGKEFEAGQVYAMHGRYYEAAKAARIHREAEHEDYLYGLLDGDSKYNTLTGNQRQLLRLFAGGKADKEIAREMGISVSTVRHQRFMFREKAKQAKMYLAIYDSVFDHAKGETPMMPIHAAAPHVDERYIVTEKEKEHILKNAFSSLEPLKLKHFSPREKKKVVVLSAIAGKFDKNREYTEKEVNEILADIFDDYVTIRRYLINYGFMDRKKDGSKYWMTEREE